MEKKIDQVWHEKELSMNLDQVAITFFLMVIAVHMVSPKTLAKVLDQAIKIQDLVSTNYLALLVT